MRGLSLTEIAKRDKLDPQGYVADYAATDQAIRVFMPKKSQKRNWRARREGVKKVARMEMVRYLGAAKRKGIKFTNKAKVLLWRHLLIQACRIQAFQPNWK